MPARTRYGYKNFFWVIAVFDGMGTQPLDRSFAVVQLCGEFRYTRKTVGNAGNGVAVPRQPSDKAFSIAPFSPSASVYPDH